MGVELLLIVPTFFYGVGFLLPSVGPRVFRKWKSTARAALLFTFVGSVYVVVLSGSVWLAVIPPLPQPVTLTRNLWAGIPAGPSSLPPLQWQIYLDPLSAFFALLTSAFSGIVAIYSIDALRAPHYLPYRNRIVSAFSLFVWSTLMVLMAYDTFFLILTLEVMTLSFGYLVLYKHWLYNDESPSHKVDATRTIDAQLAPKTYMVISHASTALLTLPLIILSLDANSMSFQKFIANAASFSTNTILATVVFVLALAGLGIRAGLTPAHVWVSLVHPSSPTPTHALSLGIAIKVAIFLMYRFFFQFLVPQANWGYALLLIAALTALVNVWYAISSHDLKTALAYHSIENIGIICVGMGIALAFWNSSPGLAGIGLVASLYHLLNHAVFKGLLYLATGAIDNLTQQTVEFAKLGGLLKRYRFTGTMFLIGSFAISGFPPLNGFVSEWLTLQSLYGGLFVSGSPLTLALPIILATLFVLTSSFALTAFCFYKIVGLSLLGRPRSPEPERNPQGTINNQIDRRASWAEKDVPWKMRSGMLIMAFLCLVLGVFPAQMVPLLGRALQPLNYDPAGFQSNRDLTVLWSKNTMPDFLPIWAILGIGFVILVVPFGLSYRRRVHRPVIPWNGGAPHNTFAAQQFTSSATSFLLRDLFDFVSSSRLARRAPDYPADNDVLDRPLPDLLPSRMVLSRSKLFPQQITEIFRAIANYLIFFSWRASERFGEWMQNKEIRRYLFYILIANLFALIVFIIARWE